MIKDKVLVFAPYSFDPLKGGPGGFIASNYMKKKPSCIELAIDSREASRESFCNQIANKLIWRARYSSKIGDGTSYYQNIWRSTRYLHSNYAASNYKYLYFHDVFSLYFSLSRISSKQVVILQPHMPELPHLELISFGFKANSNMVVWTRDYVTHRAFSRANYVILPNQGALKIYDNLPGVDTKAVYVASGAACLDASVQLDLDKSLTYYLYIGRRQRVKGFDLILEGFRKAYRLNKNIRLLLAGEGSLIIEDGIIDLGQTSRPGLLMSSVDYFVSCNRQSYFDRSVIEALSVGCPLLISCTYGHSELRDASPGIIDIGEPSVDALSDAIFRQSTKKPSEAVRLANIALYQRRYTPESHRQNLVFALKKIMSTHASAKHLVASVKS